MNKYTTLALPDYDVAKIRIVMGNNDSVWQPRDILNLPGRSEELEL
jgi:hypothetical protein